MRHASLALALVLAAPATADQIPGSDFTSGFWVGSAQTDDKGAFSHCSVSVGSANGDTLWFGFYTNDTVSVLMSSPRVRFRAGEQFDAWLMTEIGLPTKGVAEAWDEGFAGMTLTGIDASIAFLTNGRYLRQVGIGIDDAFDVQGIPEALALARDCMQSQTGGGISRPPPKVPDLKPKTSPGFGAGGGAGAKPGQGLGTPAPKPSP
jgi:hypothetical protein